MPPELLSAKVDLESKVYNSVHLETSQKRTPQFGVIEIEMRWAHDSSVFVFTYIMCKKEVV